MLKKLILMLVLLSTVAFSQAQFNDSHTIIQLFGVANGGGAMVTRTEAMLIFPRRPDKLKPVGVYDGDLNFISFVKIADMEKDGMYFCQMNNEYSIIQWFKRYNYIWFTTTDIYGDQMTFKLNLAGFTKHFNNLR